tara:strand:+ start:300 stop:629 length:330 start_codon:yes stop_codon:yes gene_type:complete
MTLSYSEVPLKEHEAIEFSENPIRAYDPHGARSNNSFMVMYHSFVLFIRQECQRIITANSSDLTQRRRLAEIKSMYYKVREKVDNFAYHSGVALLPKYTYNLSSRKSAL